MCLVIFHGFVFATSGKNSSQLKTIQTFVFFDSVSNICNAETTGMIQEKMV